MTKKVQKDIQLGNIEITEELELKKAKVRVNLGLDGEVLENIRDDAKKMRCLAMIISIKD